MGNFANFVGSTARAATRGDPFRPCFGLPVVDCFAIGKLQYSRQCNFRTKGSAIHARFITIERELASVSPRLATTMDTTLSIRELLFTLLLKVGVASSIAALLARWNTFRRVLFTEERDADQKLKLMLFMTPPLIVGVTLRLVSPYYRFADLSLEGAFLTGLLGGRVVGPIGGGLLPQPHFLAHAAARPTPAPPPRPLRGVFVPRDSSPETLSVLRPLSL